MAGGQIGTRRILIAGAGIAGLTAALAFARAGFAAQLFEQSERLAEVGAGLQLSPNATRLLARLGVLEHLVPVATRPESVVLHAGARMEPVTHVPLGTAAEQRWHAPYLVIHRADLQAALLAAVAAEPSVTLRLGATLQDLSFGNDSVAATFLTAGGKETANGDLFIGADGVWSRTRQILGGAASGFSGNVAWRATIDREVASTSTVPLCDDCVSAFMAGHIHMVAYPISAGRQINLVAIMRGTDFGQRWEAAADPSELHAAAARASPHLAEITTKAGPWVAWALHAVPPTGRWVDHRGAALIGDAAHAMAPFAAQGAAMGIEDAVALAASFAKADGNIAEALRHYEAVRRPRVARVIKRGAFNHFTWHAKGPVALVRNIVLRARSPQRNAADLDWLYGHDAEAA